MYYNCVTCCDTLSGKQLLESVFSLLCNCLPDDYQSTLVKLKSIPQLSEDDHQQLGTMISSSCEAILVKEKIITFLIVKLCYNGSGGSLVVLCDVMSNLIESEELIHCVREALCGKLPTNFYHINKTLLKNLCKYLIPCIVQLLTQCRTPIHTSDSILLIPCLNSSPCNVPIKYNLNL